MEVKMKIVANRMWENRNIIEVSTKNIARMYLSGINGKFH